MHEKGAGAGLTLKADALSQGGLDAKQTTSAEQVDRLASGRKNGEILSLSDMDILGIFHSKYYTFLWMRLIHTIHYTKPKYIQKYQKHLDYG